MHTRTLQMPADQVEVLRFLEKAATDTGRYGLSENKLALIELDDGRSGSGVVAFEGEAIVAYVGLAPARAAGEWAMEIVTGVVETDTGRLVEAAVSRLLDLGGDRLRWWVYDAEFHHLPPLYGFEAERDLLLMRRRLPAPATDFPPGFTVTGFRPGVDDAAFLKVNNAAFAAHRENGAMTPEDLRRRIAMDWFDPQGLRLAWEGDDLAGFCWTKVHSTGEGEIYIIGASPAHQGRGLGRGLVEEGMRQLAGRGCEEVILYTDGENTRAIRLYEALGFEVGRVHRAFVRQL